MSRQAVPGIDPEGKHLPIKLDSTSNGEFVPVPLSNANRADGMAVAGAECMLLRCGMGEYITSFRREKDGIWICLEPVTITHPTGRIEVAPGGTFRKGTVYMGVDLAAWLDEQLLDLLKKGNCSNR